MRRPRSSSKQGHGSRQGPIQVPYGPFLTLCIFLFVVLVVGGASRADMLGQAVVRGAACVALAVAALVHAPARQRSLGMVGRLLVAALLLALVQLVPLPFPVWSSLPGRSFFVQAAGNSAVWRPLSIVPGATINAAFSMLVPFTVWTLMRRLEPADWDRMPALLLSLVGASMFVGVVQFSGGGFDNPFINETPDMISGLFANRNHFALFLATGLALTPLWIVQHRSGWAWRWPVGGGVIVMLLLMILASGSRAGMILGGLGLAAGCVVSFPHWHARFGSWGRMRIGVGATLAVTLLAGVLLASIQGDRARSVTRAMSLQVGEDMRVRAAPVVFDMARTYFPFGAGFGGFDPLFRIHEPFALLKPTYFNRAHDDLLELVLDGGLPALILLLVAIAWWATASWRAWRDHPTRWAVRARMGSAILLLVLLSSVVDYPARTPMIMAVMVIAALWLQRPRPDAAAALP